MKHAEIEKRVLRLWTNTQVPLTPANVQVYTGATRAEVTKALDQMASEQTLELTSDDDGNLLYVVPGAARMPKGPGTVGEAMKLEALTAEVRASSSSSSSDPFALAPGQKSVVASGLLSFFFGPFGLLYAAPVVEAIVPIGVLCAVAAVLPHAIVSPVLGALAPIFGIAGVVYALRHNKNGKRTSLLSPPSSSPKRLR